MNTSLRTWARLACMDGSARAIRQTARLSVAEVAQRVGVSGPAVTRWENGTREPRGDAAERYGQVLMDIEDSLPSELLDESGLKRRAARYLRLKEQAA